MKQTNYHMMMNCTPVRKVCFMLFITYIICMLTAGNETPQLKGPQTPELDSLINEPYKAHDYGRIMALADLYQQTGALSDLKAYYWRGYAYSRQRKVRLAEMEWKEAVSLDIKNQEDLEYYSKSANRLAGLLYMKFDYEGVMRVAAPAIKLLKERNYTMNTDFANIQTFIGSCQLKLGNQQEAANGFANAYKCYKQVTDQRGPIANNTFPSSASSPLLMPIPRQDIIRKLMTGQSASIPC